MLFVQERRGAAGSVSNESEQIGEIAGPTKTVRMCGRACYLAPMDSILKVCNTSSERAHGKARYSFVRPHTLVTQTAKILR